MHDSPLSAKTNAIGRDENEKGKPGEKAHSLGGKRSKAACGPIRAYGKPGRPPGRAIKKQSRPFGQLCLFHGQLALVAHLSEALAAEHRTVGLGLEGHLCLAAAASAGSSEELTGAAGSVLASVTASLAALGLVLEAALSVEFLLTGGENELVAALFAN